MDECLQLHGGAGYMDEYRISRMYADARISRIYAGRSEVMKEIISRGIGLDDRKMRIAARHNPPRSLSACATARAILSRLRT